MADFLPAEEEFDIQASILNTLIETIDVSARQDRLTRHQIQGVDLPIIPPGGQNTMAAAAVVLLAAHFEEYVRQQIEEYAKAIIAEHSHFKEDFKHKFIDSYWRSGTARLAAIRPKGSLVWLTNAETILRDLVEYPVIGNIQAFRPEYVCTHDNNMRWDTVCELASRVGIKSLGDLMFKSKQLKDILDNPKKDQFSSTIQRKMNSFYELRNGIVHSISHNSGIGATIFISWSKFFRIFTKSFTSSLDASLKQFELEIQVRKKSEIPVEI